MKVLFPHAGSPFTRIIVDNDADLSCDQIEPYAERAVELADRDGLPVHIQSEDEFTRLIIYPDLA